MVKKEAIKPLTQKRFKIEFSASENLAKKIQRAKRVVWKRDEGRCSYVSPEGKVLEKHIWHCFCLSLWGVKLEDIKRLSDEQLLRLGFCVGREIDRRWNGKTGSEPPHFQDCKDVFSYFHYRLWAKKQEYLCSLLLNHKNQLLAERVISIGTVNSSLIHAREVFAPAIEKRASGILLIHNHPSGNATPSPEDLKVTERLKKVGKLVGIPLLDHLIIGKNQYYSDSVKEVIHL